MQIQKVFKAGNSLVVSVPKDFAKLGEKVAVQETQGVLVIKKQSKKSTQKASEKDFDKWLKVFMEENGEILDDLAIR